MKQQPEVWFESTHTLARREGRDGVGHYTEELIRHVAAGRPGQDLSLVGNVFWGQAPQLPPDLASSMRLRLSRWFPTKVWNRLFRYGLMPALNRLIPGRPDLVVFLNFTRYPLSRGIKSMVAVHDLTFVHYPERVKPSNLSFLRTFVPRSLRQADHVIAISEFTKRDLHDQFAVPLNKITVVPPGVDLKLYRPGLDVSATRDQLGLPEHYFLRVSTIEPRKNDVTLLQAYRALPEAIRRQYALVICGKVGWQDAETTRVMELIRQGDSVGQIIHLGYVAETAMPALYAGATAFVLASHFEGFGMPALEAMACGVPVLTSNTSSIPEVVSGAGLMVDPLDVAGFTEGLRRLATEPALRADLAQRGRARAEQYSWEASARKLQGAIDRALSVPLPRGQ